MQIDISNASAIPEYERILSQLQAMGINHVTFGPRNSNVSARANATDSWGWEEVLWLTLGEDIRENRWMPNDPLPSTVQTFVTMAQRLGVGLNPYIYPILAFQQNPAWLNPDGKQAQIGDVTLQNWLLDTINAFVTQTGARGATFDYTFFNSQDYSLYAQWYGWRRVLAALRLQHDGFAIDSRQLNHQWGPWMWAAGSYAEPYMSDENVGCPQVVSRDWPDVSGYF